MRRGPFPINDHHPYHYSAHQKKSTTSPQISVSVKQTRNEKKKKKIRCVYPSTQRQNINNNIYYYGFESLILLIVSLYLLCIYRAFCDITWYVLLYFSLSADLCQPRLDGSIIWPPVKTTDSLRRLPDLLNHSYNNNLTKTLFWNIFTLLTKMDYFAIHLPLCYGFSVVASPNSVQFITKLSFFSLPTTITLWITHHFISSCLPPLTPSLRPHTLPYESSRNFLFLWTIDTLGALGLFFTATQVSCVRPTQSSRHTPSPCFKDQRLS